MEREDLSQMVAGEIHRQQARHHQGPVLSILFYNQDCFFAFYYINYISNYRQCSDVIPLIFLLTRNKRSISICGKMKRSVLENLRVGGVKMTTQKLPKRRKFSMFHSMSSAQFYIDLVIRVDWVVFIKIQWIKG